MFVPLVARSATPRRSVRAARSALGAAFAMLILLLAALPAPAATAASAKPTWSKPAVSVAAPGTATIKGSIKRAPAGALQLGLQEQSGKRWKTLPKTELKATTLSAKRTFAVRWTPSAVRTKTAVRLVLRTKAGKTLSTSKAIKLEFPAQPGAPTKPQAPPTDPPQPSAPDPTPPSVSPVPAVIPPAPALQKDGYAVPATTREYGAADVDAAVAGPSPDQAIITVDPSAPAPVRGGHLAIGRTADFPQGMFAKVVGTGTTTAGRATATIEPAPIDEVFENVDYDFDADVEPQLVDADGNVLASSDSGSLELLPEGRRGRARSASWFTCKNAAGVEVESTTL